MEFTTKMLDTRRTDSLQCLVHSKMLCQRGLQSIIVLFSICSASFLNAEEEAVLAVLRSHCVDCHVGEDAPGGIDLSGDQIPDLELFEEIVEVVSEHAMPPADHTDFELGERESLIALLKAHFLELAYQQPLPQVAIRRMNRFQYNNAVQDLFGLKVDVFALPERMLREYDYYDPASGVMPPRLKAGSRPLGKSQLIDKRLAGVAPFPQDLRAENGFDNRADHLSLSPLLLESFMRLSNSIVESVDFNRGTVGRWNELFEAPKKGQDVSRAFRERIGPFLKRAFRGPIDEVTLERYASFANSRIESGTSFEQAMKAVASAVIASPRFLYLYDANTDSDLALASRLSFFLWGSIPDEELLRAAASGVLKSNAGLQAQVTRMLNDRRSKRFCDSFPSQWLQLERIISSVPDPKTFPRFYFAKFRVSMHMMLEPLLLFETVLVENRSVFDLINPDFSYRSELLEAWYRNDGSRAPTPPTSIPFKRLEIADQREGGVITNAAVMTMTSGPLESKPITRGAWMLSVILNDPPEPPPADVPPLPNNDEGVEHLTIRERFASHRSEEACAGCHREIDPLGFALENFDPVGRWREHYESDLPIDCEGVLQGRFHFRNVAELKQILVEEKGIFLNAFAKHMLSFAIGRETVSSDIRSIESIVKASRESEFRMREFISAVVLSPSFRENKVPAK